MLFTKYQKQNNLFLNILCALLFLSIEISFAQPCEIDNQYCSSTWSAEKFRAINVPSCPNCDITVYFQTRDCPFGTELVINHISENVLDCSDLMDDIFPYGFLGGVDETVVSQLWQEMTNVLLETLFMELYNSLNPGDRFLVECDNDNFYEYHLIDGACQALCLQYFYGPTGMSDGEMLISYPDCAEACCVQVNSLCYNTVTQEIEKNTFEGIFYGDEFLDCETLPSPVCSGANWNYVGDCEVVCESSEE